MLTGSACCKQTVQQPDRSSSTCTFTWCLDMRATDHRCAGIAMLRLPLQVAETHALIAGS